LTPQKRARPALRPASRQIVGFEPRRAALSGAPQLDYIRLRRRAFFLAFFLPAFFVARLFLAMGMTSLKHRD
jgi:hypothetical protein